MKARMAIARKLLIIVTRALGTMKPYEEPTPKEPTARSKEKSIRWHVLELKNLGVDIPFPCISA
jgi:hypothetical protein